MKVFLLTDSSPDDGYTVLGVFSTRQLAIGAFSAFSQYLTEDDIFEFELDLVPEGESYIQGYKARVCVLSENDAVFNTKIKQSERGQGSAFVMYGSPRGIGGCAFGYGATEEEAKMFAREALNESLKSC